MHLSHKKKFGKLSLCSCAIKQPFFSNSSCMTFLKYRYYKLLQLFFFFLLHMLGGLLVLPWRRPNRNNRPAVHGLERKKSSTKINIWQSTMQVGKKKQVCL